MHIAIDTETFYSKEYSIADLGNYAYTHHPEFDCYLLTAAYEDGATWAGHPRDFDWDSVTGHTIIMHNAGFDTAVVRRLVELGVAPYFKPDQIFDTADLSAYLGVPRSLKEASKCLLGVDISKAVRSAAKGKHWDDFDEEEQAAMLEYAQQDAVLTLRIWLENGSKWPEDEWIISGLTRGMCDSGLPVNIASVEAGIAQLEVLLAKIRDQIPWAAGNPDAAALSPKALAVECEKIGIAPPKSMAKDSEVFTDWLKANGDQVPFAVAMGQYRSVNMFLKKLQVMRLRTKNDGVMPYALKYAGAHTLRDSGDSGFNPQNMSRTPMFGPLLVEHGVVAYPNNAIDNPDAGKILANCGIDMRSMIEAPEGKLLGVVDLSAIEPCSLADLSGDQELVDLLESGMDPYEAQARLDGEYDGSEPLKDADKALRQYNKVKVLGCGYGAGPEKVQFIAKTMVGIDLSLEQCQALVARFRARPFITGLWRNLERGMRKVAGGDFTVEVPNGGELRYRDVRNMGGSVSAVIPRQGRMMRLKYWGGTLTENLVQRVARDVFMNRIIDLHWAGLPPILRVHDEAVFIFDQETAESNLKTAIRIMSTKPEWMPNLPISADGHLCKKYSKS